MLEEFAKVVMEVIPECVFANYRNDEINNLNAVGKLREAAHSIYKIKEFELMRRYYMNGDLQAKQELDKSTYKNRGEFGELILHLLLRDFKGTIPLVSKAYFKEYQHLDSILYIFHQMKGFYGLERVNFVVMVKLEWLIWVKDYSYLK